MNVLERIRWDIGASISIARRYMRIYYIRPGTIMFGLMFPLFMFLSFAVGRRIPASMLISSLISITLLFSSSSVGPMILPMERRLKTIERLLVAPISFYSILLGVILCSMVYSISISIVPVFIGLLFLGVEVVNLLSLAVGIFFSSMCFASLGMMFASYPTEYPGNVTMALNFLRLPLLFISGVFIPLENLPDWQRTIAFISPLTYCNDLMRRSVGGGYLNPVLDAAALLAFTILFLVAGMKIHVMFSDTASTSRPVRRMPEYGQRRHGPRERDTDPPA